MGRCAFTPEPGPESEAVTTSEERMQKSESSRVP